MKLVILGSGTCVPSLRRNAPANYLAIGGRELLVDCGSGTLLQLERAGKSYRDIDAVFLTHFHPDHVADFLPLVHALAATPGLERKKPLSLVGPPGVPEFYEKFISSLMRGKPPFPLEVTEANGRLDMGSFFVFSAKTVHSGESVAYRFEENGRSVIFTGDCDYDEGIIRLSEGADLLVADCSFPDEMKTPGHLSPRECGLIARQAGAGKLVLTHLYPSPYPENNRVTEAGEVFAGDIVLAEDLMEFDIP
jgi:ribonuclease BN (tRNA processing enzyme)